MELTFVDVVTQTHKTQRSFSTIFLLIIAPETRTTYANCPIEGGESHQISMPTGSLQLQFVCHQVVVLEDGGEARPIIFLYDTCLHTSTGGVMLCCSLTMIYDVSNQPVQ